MIEIVKQKHKKEWKFPVKILTNKRKLDIYFKMSGTAKEIEIHKDHFFLPPMPSQQRGNADFVQNY